jgi:hypothetical protein
MTKQSTVLLATPEADIGLTPARTAKRKAKQIAAATGKPVTVRDATTDKVIATAKPANRKHAAKPKTKANGKAKPKPKPKHRNDGPQGKVALVLKLASRPNGASRKELIEATSWEKLPWRWSFENPKGTGWTQRHGLSFKVIERKSGEAAYKVSR